MPNRTDTKSDYRPQIAFTVGQEIVQTPNRLYNLPPPPNLDQVQFGVCMIRGLYDLPPLKS